MVGFSSIFLPFKGGTLVPAPDLIIPLPTLASGDISVPFTWPGGIPAGFKLVERLEFLPAQHYFIFEKD